MMLSLPSSFYVTLITLSLLAPCGECGIIELLGAKSSWWTLAEHTKVFILEDAFDAIRDGDSIKITGDFFVRRTLTTSKKNVRLFSTEGATVRFAPGLSKLVDFTGADIELFGVTFADFEIPFDVSNADVEIRDCTFTSESGQILRKIDEDSHEVTSLLVSKSKFVQTTAQPSPVPEYGGLMQFDMSKSRLVVLDSDFSGGRAQYGGCVSVRFWGDETYPPIRARFLRNNWYQCTASSEESWHHLDTGTKRSQASAYYLLPDSTMENGNKANISPLVLAPTPAPLHNPTLCDQSMRMAVGTQGMTQKECLDSGHCWNENSSTSCTVFLVPENPSTSFECYARWNEGAVKAVAFTEGTSCYVQGPDRHGVPGRSATEADCLRVHACWNVSPGYPSCYWPTNTA